MIFFYVTKYVCIIPMGSYCEFSTKKFFEWLIFFRFKSIFNFVKLLWQSTFTNFQFRKIRINQKIQIINRKREINQNFNHRNEFHALIPRIFNLIELEFFFPNQLPEQEKKYRAEY